jgi:hypothetical protein
LVVEGYKEEDCHDISSDFEEISPTEHVKAWEEKGYSHMDAIKNAAKERGMKKSDFYKLLTDEKK